MIATEFIPAMENSTKLVRLPHDLVFPFVQRLGFGVFSVGRHFVVKTVTFAFFLNINVEK